MIGSTLPEFIGPYAVERSLGSGGMGEVYLAYSTGGNPVAIKVIRPDRTDPHTRARFEREAEIARTISGTGRVARFLEADPFAELPWIAMDYVPGRTLVEVVKEQGPLSAALVASMGALLAEGLAAVHATGLLHRDLKASNVMLGDFGPVIIDFGLGVFLDASLGSMSQGLAFLGTVPCMPPEQAAGETRVTQAADVYGLGTVLLYAATGHYPYDGAGWAAIAVQVVSRDHGPDLGGAPEDLLPVISSMLAHDPQDRPSLEQVTRQCAEVMRRLGTHPVSARHALIQKTVVEDRAAVALPQPDPRMFYRLDALERRLREPEPEPAVEEPTPEDAAAPLDAAASAEPVADTPMPALSPVRSSRPPASRRVAGELRRRYAASAELAWSSR
ncbi:serine/threonine-protein kinase [Streptomyces sp. SCSIO ZS0520]|uniref:serine/threonine-protein kinase n=1 Tax=Streptomyces sp. SCSIO ZS0520 TaxID=2892996 RepID=UPI0021DAE42D|nr:serine/threonine-protein kinase [Streptomyces sp. SCSIO ZS0520]